MSKHYLKDIKVKAGEGADGKWWIDTESASFGTIIISGDTPAEAIAKLIGKMSNVVTN